MTMPSRSKRDPATDTARLVAVLRDDPDRVFDNAGVGNLGDLADVPKPLIRRLLEGHPNVIISKVGQKYKFQYKPLA
jgi:hypothetical protein